MKTPFLKKAAWLAVLLAGSLAVHAVPTLWIYDSSGGSVTIADQGAGDTDTIPGIVSWSGNVGQWYVQVTTGITKPEIGSAVSPRFDLLTLDTFKTGPAPGTLWVEFSENDFTVPLPAGAVLGIGGTLDTSASMVYEAWVGHDNAVFTKSALIKSLGPFYPGVGGSFGGAAISGVPAPPSPGNVSFTQVLKITDTAVGGYSSMNATLAVPDAGSTLSLLGLALAGLGMLARSRKK